MGVSLEFLGLICARSIGSHGNAPDLWDLDFFGTDLCEVDWKSRKCDWFVRFWFFSHFHHCCVGGSFEISSFTCTWKFLWHFWDWFLRFWFFSHFLHCCVGESFGILSFTCTMVFLCRNTFYFIGTSLFFKICPSLGQKTTLQTDQKPKGGPLDEKILFFKNVLQSF